MVSLLLNHSDIIEEAFTGGLLYGLLSDYPMNLSMALGINVR